MKQYQKLIIALLILGLLFVAVIGKVFLKLNSGEFQKVEKQAKYFLDLLSQNKYLEAFQLVDSSQISIEDLEEMSSIASHYLSKAIYFYQSNKNVYTIGYKTIINDKDPINDNKLEFIISKVKGEWKVTYISYRH